MKRKMQTIITLMMMLLIVTGQATPAQEKSQKAKPGQTQPQGAFPPPSGNGTPGQITKWTSASTLGDSVISEDKFGKIGVGTTTPNSKFTVASMIETTAQGVKYPDGTVQTTAAVSGLNAVVHDDTLTGKGTQVSPLSVAATDPARQAFTHTLVSGGPPTDNFYVPQGKLLVIEQISGEGYITSGLKFLTVALTFSSVIDGNQAFVRHYFVPQSMGVQDSGGDKFDISAFNQPCRIYVVQGGLVSLVLEASGGGAFGYSMTISGHLVDAQ